VTAARDAKNEATGAGAGVTFIAKRIIYNPDPPTLPRRRSDTALAVAILLELAFLVALLVVAANASASGVTPQTATPAPVRYIECPWCHGVFTAAVRADGRWVFTEHDYVRIPMSVTAYYETCAATFKKHLAEIVELLRRVSDGRIVETAPKVNP
jgi:hypothetical protein